MTCLQAEGFAVFVGVGRGERAVAVASAGGQRDHRHRVLPQTHRAVVTEGDGEQRRRAALCAGAGRPGRPGSGSSGTGPKRGGAVEAGAGDTVDDGQKEQRDPAPRTEHGSLPAAQEQQDAANRD